MLVITPCPNTAAVTSDLIATPHGRICTARRVRHRGSHRADRRCSLDVRGISPDRGIRSIAADQLDRLLTTSLSHRTGGPLSLIRGLRAYFPNDRQRPQETPSAGADGRSSTSGAARRRLQREREAAADASVLEGMQFLWHQPAHSPTLQVCARC